MRLPAPTVAPSPITDGPSIRTSSPISQPGPSRTGPLEVALALVRLAAAEAVDDLADLLDLNRAAEGVEVLSRSSPKLPTSFQ